MTPKVHLTPQDILDTPAEFANQLEVRSAAPALVLILEREAPLRLEVLSSTDAEFEALQEECRSNPRWRAILDGWYAAKDDEDDIGTRRESRHAERLDAGRPLANLRVSDRAEPRKVPNGI
jgi:hypothetical protein